MKYEERKQALSQESVINGTVLVEIIEYIDDTLSGTDFVQIFNLADGAKLNPLYKTWSCHAWRERLMRRI